MVFVIADVLSAIIMGLGMTDTVSGILLALLSLPLILMPSSLLPVMFVASWSSSLSVLGISAFYYYFALFLLSSVVTPNSVKWNIKSNLLPVIFLGMFLLWMLFSAINSVSGEIYDPFKICLFILFPIVTSCCSIPDLNVCYKSLMAISLIFAVYFLLRGAIAPIELYDPDFMTIEKTLIEGVGTNVVAQAIVMMSLYSFAFSIHIKRYDFLVISLLFFFSLFYLGSRTAMYTTIAGIILYFIFCVNTKRTAKLILGITLVVAAVIFLILGNSFENFIRLDLSSLREDQGSGRFINWALYMVNIVPNYLWTGIGPSIINFETLGYRSDADNLYMDLLCELVIPGVILFFCVFVCLIYKASKIKSGFYKGLFMIMMLSFLCIGLGETVFDTSLFWFVSGMMMLEHNNKPKRRLFVLAK